MLPLPRISRPPGNQAKPAADTTDWTALTPDDFFAAPTAACRAESVPAAAVPETERRLAGGVLQARELHPGRLLRLSAGMHTWRRLRRLHTEFPRLGFQSMTPTDSVSPIVTFSNENMRPLAAKLRQAKIDVAVYPHRIRMSPSVYNDQSDIARLLAALS